jgi:hypothetical protein
MFRPEVDESLFMTVQQSVPVATSKPKVDFQEIHQLIESFQQLLLFLVVAFCVGF